MDLFQRVTKLATNTVKRATNVGVALIDNNANVVNKIGEETDGILDDTGAFAESLLADGKAIGNKLIDTAKSKYEQGKALIPKKSQVEVQTQPAPEQTPDSEFRIKEFGE